MSIEYIPCELCSRSIDASVYYLHLLLCSPSAGQYNTTHIDNKKKEKWRVWAMDYLKIPVIEKTECSICFENCKFVKIFPCLHEFCNTCSDSWVKRQIEKNEDVLCPKCKKCVSLVPMD